VSAGDDAARSIADKLPAAVVGQLGSFNDIRVLGDPPSDRRVPRVTGSVESDGTTTRVSVRLVDGANGAEMFADSFERPAADGAALVGDAARAASVAIRQRTVERQWARLQSSAHRNEAAIALYLRGAAHLSLRREDELQRSLALFRQAATVEPTFALAHASAAEALTLLGVFRQVPIMSALRDARASALKSLELDGNLPEGHAIFGYIEKLRFDFPAAEKSLRRAIELQPDFVDAHVRLSTVLLQQGSYGDALVEIKSALALEPNSVAAQSQFAVTLLLSRRYDEAIAEAKGFLKRHPGRPIGMEIIAEAELYRGNPAGAITHFREAIANEPRGSVDPTLVAGLAMSEARAGNVRVATDMLAELQARFEHGSGGTAAEVAAVQLALGRKQDALDWLTKSVTTGESEAGYLKINPRWDALRGTPAFEELVRSVRPRT
ncbi:MAG: tetratricopeptide repeat protein, partial [Acidobacteria bacterium]